MSYLTESEKNHLEKQFKKTKDLSEWKRLFVILNFNDGKTVQELADTLRISPYTVDGYLRDYTYKKKTDNDPRGGSSSKLDENQSKELKEHLSKVTYLKIKNIRAYVLQKYRITYSRSGMNAWLIQNGFTYKRPQKVPGKLDPLKQEAFVEYYKKLKDSLLPDEELHFGDGTHPQHQSQNVCGWIQKGEQKTLQTTGKQRRIHIMGTLRLDGMSVFTKEYETINSDNIIDFFKDIERRSNARCIHIILDNARAGKCKKIDEYLKSSRIKVHYLPPYSPNLNPIERLWKIMREMKIYNRFYKCYKTFFTEIRKFFNEDIFQIKDILNARINDNFQKINLNPILLT